MGASTKAISWRDLSKIAICSLALPLSLCCFPTQLIVATVRLSISSLPSLSREFANHLHQHEIMTEYWKSIPKKYCDICKVWMQDNKISVEHHERGFSHQANIRKRLAEIRKEGTARAKEKAAHDAEIRRIEAEALKSFQSDIAADPSRAKDAPVLVTGASETPKTESRLPTSKFGETVGTDSINLAKGRGKALETIASKMQKKSKWLEAKTAEGNVYYWNRETCGECDR